MNQIGRSFTTMKRGCRLFPQPLLIRSLTGGPLHRTKRGWLLMARDRADDLESNIQVRVSAAEKELLRHGGGGQKIKQVFSSMCKVEEPLPFPQTAIFLRPRNQIGHPFHIAGDKPRMTKRRPVRVKKGLK